MKLLLVTQYFFPETGATSNRIYSLAKHFQDQGHQVHVIAERPNHPQGIFFDGYKKGAFVEKKYNDIPVTYTWVFTRPQKGFLGRVLFYLTFMTMAVLASWKLSDKYDVVVASSPPLFVGIAGWMASIIHRGKFVFDVRDLWPEVAVKMGELNNHFAISLAENIEQFLYAKADLITAVTTSFKQTIAQKGIENSKIDVIKNGTDPDIFEISAPNYRLKDELGISSNFIVAYVGNIGLAQGLEHVIESAVHMNGCRYNGITFLIVGDGPKKHDLEQKVSANNLDNVIFTGRVPLKKAAEYMNIADALLVPLANDPIYEQFVPSKLFDSMAASKPILLSVDGEAHVILAAASAGIYYDAENAEQLTENILWLKDHEQEASDMGDNGYKFVHHNYTRKAQAERMLRSFKALT